MYVHVCSSIKRAKPEGADRQSKVAARVIFWKVCLQNRYESGRFIPDDTKIHGVRLPLPGHKRPGRDARSHYSTAQSSSPPTPNGCKYSRNRPGTPPPESRLPGVRISSRGSRAAKPNVEHPGVAGWLVDGEHLLLRFAANETARGVKPNYLQNV